MLNAALDTFAEEDQEQSATANLLQRRQLGGYELLGEIGRGGMGVVFRARQRRPDRQVALKVIAAGELASPRMIQRFHAETEAAARLDHANIVSIYEVGQEDGWHYFSMRLIEGPTLAQHLNGRPLAPRQAAELLVKIARAVHHAHQRGLLHRDLKPNNILLDKNGEPILTDFGLAKILEADASLTLSQAVLGTPAYMSPEQASGQTRDTTVAADIYGLGAVFYELLSGQPPFGAANTPALLRKIVEEEPRAPSSFRSSRGQDSKSASSSDELDRDLEIICLKCLEKEPSRRYATAAELANDLERWLRHEPIHARASSAWERAVKWARRNPARAGLVATATVSLLVMALGSLLFNVHLNRARVAAEDSARQAHQQLVAKHLGEAGRLTSAGDGLTALFPLIEALRLEQGDAAREAPIRERLGLTLRLSPELLRLWDAGGAPVQLQFSPDNLQLVAVLRRGGVRVWNLFNGETMAQAATNAGAVTRSEISSDASRVLELLEAPPFARVRDLVRGSVESLPLKSSCGQAGAFSPDGKLVATGGARVRFWDAASLQPVVLAVRADEPADQLGFSPDRRFLYTVSSRGRATIWDLQSGQAREIQATLVNRGVAPRFSDDGRWLLALAAKEIQLFDTTRGQSLISAPHSGLVFDFRFSPNGRFFAVPSFREQARVWQLPGESTGPEGRIEVYRLPVRHETGANQALFSPDGRLLVTAGFDYQLRILDAVRHQLIAPVLHHTALVEAVAFSADGRFLASADANGLVRVWDLQPRGLTHLARATAKPTPQFSPDGRLLVIRETTDRLLLLDAATGRQMEPPLFTPPNFANADVRTAVEENWRTAAARGAPNDIAFDRSGRFLAAAFGIEGAKVWDCSTREVRSFTLPSSILTVAFNPAGTVLAVGTDAGGIHRWNVKDGAQAAPPLPWPHVASFLAWSGDGRWLAAGATRAVQVWDAARHATLGHTMPVDDILSTLRFSPDSARLLVAAGNDRIEPSFAKLMELPSLKPAFQSMIHGDGVAFAEFSSDGRFIATGGEDNVVKLWRASDGSAAAPAMRHGGIVNALSFDRSGRLLAAGGNDGFVRLWDVTRGELCGPAVPLGRTTPSVVFNPNSHYVLAATHTEGAWFLSLEPDRHALGDLSRIASGQTALRLGPNGPLEQIQIYELASLFARSAAAQTAFTDPAQRIAWYERIALLGESSGDQFLAVFHLERLASLKPDNPAVAARLLMARQQLLAR
jgi:eukaryotic-like serine/threonine-protein kinase